MINDSKTYELMKFTNTNIEIGRQLPCRCWVINLAQGKMIITCAMHEPKILEMLNMSPVGAVKT